MDDDFLHENRERWNALVQAGVVWSLPRLDLDEASARAFVDPHGYLGDLHGKDVLCLASGGGQQSAAFALLGANVTVLDLSDQQLENDRRAAQHYNLPMRLEQGDMRDLSRFSDRSFDVVYHVFSINFVPSVEPVYNEVQARAAPGRFLLPPVF
jgi:ubiquinone/menaquinone biosynthesis C-methylase UbiE